MTKLTLILFSLILSSYCVSKETIKLNSSIISKKLISPNINQTKDTILVFSQQKNGQRQLYTGGEKNEHNNTQTNGIYIRKKSDLKIEYEYTQLINWKLKFKISGTASLEPKLVSINTVNELKENAYKFIDREKKITIYVTKNTSINETRAKVYFEKENLYSPLLYNK